MTIEVCDICKNPLTSDDYKNNFGIKMKLTKKYRECSFMDEYTIKKKFKLCNHCKEAIAIAIKEYSEFMRRNGQVELIPKFYTVEDTASKVLKHCGFPNTMKKECIWLEGTKCTYDKECENQVIYNIPG